MVAQASRVVTAGIQIYAEFFPITKPTKIAIHSKWSLQLPRFCLCHSRRELQIASELADVLKY